MVDERGLAGAHRQGPETLIVQRLRIGAQVIIVHDALMPDASSVEDCESAWRHGRRFCRGTRDGIAILVRGRGWRARAVHRRVPRQLATEVSG